MCNCLRCIHFFFTSVRNILILRKTFAFVFLFYYQTFGPSLKERVIDLSNIIIIICQIFEIVILRGFGKRKRSSKKNGGRLVEISAVDQ